MYHKPDLFVCHWRLLILLFGSSQPDHWLQKYGCFKFRMVGINMYVHVSWGIDRYIRVLTDICRYHDWTWNIDVHVFSGLLLGQHDDKQIETISGRNFAIEEDESIMQIGEPSAQRMPSMSESRIGKVIYIHIWEGLGTGHSRMTERRLRVAHSQWNQIARRCVRANLSKGWAIYFKHFKFKVEAIVITVC